MSQPTTMQDDAIRWATRPLRLGSLRSRPRGTPYIRVFHETGVVVLELPERAP
jgi:hypothetical protein